MSQDTLKLLVSQAAADYVLAHTPAGAVIGIGTGSTANHFIDVLAERKVFGSRYRGAVSSSNASTSRLQMHGIEVFELNQIETLPVYIDGADEINHHGHMIKGGGGALTREKIIAMVAETFICIADDSKRVDTLGHFALPVEVMPIARNALSRKLLALGGMPVLRTTSNGTPYLTDNGNQIIDVQHLNITDPLTLEAEINSWPGVVTVGLFAKRHANLCLLASAAGIETIQYA
ncbi:hypothetical protein CPC16_007760 [Podila verticillata]|nr:hypothetical protein CPC16_007760 [Podila verticillata]